MNLSDFGKKLSGESGIGRLMDDIGKPLPKNLETVCQLGGGNPARVPEIEAMYRRRAMEILAHGNDFENLIGRYDAPQGNTEFLETAARYLSRELGWNITKRNIAVTNGSQSAFFYLFNMFCGTSGAEKKLKKIVFPLAPEYVGYADQAVEEGCMVCVPSRVEKIDEHSFKYKVDFELLEKYLDTHDDTGALCVTRPTNPSGNVLTDGETARLARAAKAHNVPFFIDNAYGLPWPDIIFCDAKPYWDSNTVVSMSLSKIGLPSMRAGIVIAREEIINAISRVNAIAALASNGMGQALALASIESGELVDAAKKHVRPFYEKKSRFMRRAIEKYFAGTEWAVHKSEGAIFLWLLMPRLRVSTMELYETLKARGVFVMPGEYFFFGGARDGSLPPVQSHPHYSKCLRLNFARGDDEIDTGIRIIAEEYKRAML